MIFSDEYSLIDGNRLESSFREFNTQFNVVQGQISAIVAKSGIDKMQSGDQPIYEQLSSIKQTTSSISAVVSDMNGYLITDPETGKTTPVTLKSKIANMDLTASKIELSVSDIENDYTTEEKLNRAISSHRAQIKLENGTVKMVTDSYDGGRWSSSSVDLGDEIRLQTTGPIVWNADNSTMTDRGTLTCNGGNIAGWKINPQKIYGGDSSTGVAVMQLPLRSVTNVFAAGGSSHSNYSDCPFRVTREGKLYATKAELEGSLISRYTINYAKLDGASLQLGWSNTNHFMLSTGSGVSDIWSDLTVRIISPQIAVGTSSESFQCRNSAYFYLPVRMNTDGTVAEWQQVRVYHGLIL